MANTNLSDLSVEQLKKAVQIKEEIAALQNQLAGILGGKATGNGNAVASGAAQGGRRTMSSAARAKIAAAQRARWAKVKGGSAKAAPKAAAKSGKRTMSPAARAKIAAAARARWAKIKAGK